MPSNDQAFYLIYFCIKTKHPLIYLFYIDTNLFV